MNRMYDELAAWWPLLSPPDEYEEEAAFFIQVLEEAGLPPAPTLLELGCGGGNNALHMKAHFAQVTLTDLSPAMLDVSRALNPDCEHLQADMRTVRLGRTFDVLFIHDAIEYMVTLDELRQALATAAAHCRPGGLALIVPDQVRERFVPTTSHGGHDGERRGLRYLEWTPEVAEGASSYSTEYLFLLHEQGQPSRHLYERHTHGLHARADWLRLLREVGFEPRVRVDDYDRELFIARRVVPAQPSGT